MEEEKAQEWCPLAVDYRPTRMKIRGTYAGGYPRGAVVHYTAGRFLKGLEDAKRCIDGGIKNGYTYLCIARTGEIVQAHPISGWGYHCGESRWNKVPRALRLFGSLSNDLIGIEMNNAGKLTKQKNGTFKAWYGDLIPEADVRYVEEKNYGCPTGYYHKYSGKQEESLAKLLMWLKRNDPLNIFSFDHVLGHHEVSGKLELGYWRKVDPGGSLSMPMTHFRQYLKDREKYFTTPLG